MAAREPCVLAVPGLRAIAAQELRTPRTPTPPPRRCPAPPMTSCRGGRPNHRRRPSALFRAQYGTMARSTSWTSRRRPRSRSCLHPRRPGAPRAEPRAQACLHITPWPRPSSLPRLARRRALGSYPCSKTRPATTTEIRHPRLQRKDAQPLLLYDDYRAAKILAVQMPTFSCEEATNEFETLTRDAGRVQQDTLKRILQLNADAEYLNHFGLNGRTDVQSYKSCIPLCAHSDLEPYIQRIADGYSSPLLTGKPVTSLSLSSGTTQGKPKFVPFNDELLENTLQISQTSYAFRNREYPIGKGKALQFVYSSKQMVTKGEVLATTATTNLYMMPRYKEGMP